MPAFATQCSQRMIRISEKVNFFDSWDGKYNFVIY